MPTPNPEAAMETFGPLDSEVKEKEMQVEMPSTLDQLGDDLTKSMMDELKLQDAKANALTKAEILNQAIGVTSNRNESYDAPEDNFARIAGLWTAWSKAKGWDVEFTELDVAYMMVLMKLGRLAFNPTHHDSIVDGSGYFACGGQIASIERNKQS